MITTETYQLECGEFTDLVIGEGLTKVVIGAYGDKSGVELIIGGSVINQYLADVLTLADVAQLRDNLNALLADPRAATRELDAYARMPGADLASLAARLMK